MLNTLGGGGKRGNQLIQFGGSLNSISATIVPVFVGYLMGNVATATINKANPALFIAIGIFALAFIVLYFMQIPEPAQEIEAQKESAEGVKDPHSALSFRHFILGAVAISFTWVSKSVFRTSSTCFCRRLSMPWTACRGWGMKRPWPGRSAELTGS